MVRLRGKKSFEEVYGQSCEGKYQKASKDTAQKTTRKDINSFTIPPYEGANTMRHNSQMTSTKMGNTSTDMTHRKMARTRPDVAAAQLHMKEDRLASMTSDKVKRDPSRLRTTRLEKEDKNMIYLDQRSQVHGLNRTAVNTRTQPPHTHQQQKSFPKSQAKVPPGSSIQSSASQTKLSTNAERQERQERHHRQERQERHERLERQDYVAERDERLQRDDDDEAEEFFEMIKLTVEAAVARKINDLMGRSMAEVNAKLDRFQVELKSTQNMISKVQSELNKQVAHYGEEEEKHFRYLCMKSEYDKMFFQQQSLAGATSTSSQPCLLTNPLMASGSMPPLSQMPSFVPPNMQVPMQMPVSVPLSVSTSSGQPLVAKTMTSRLSKDFPGKAAGDLKVPCSCRTIGPNRSSINTIQTSSSHTATANVEAINSQTLKNIAADDGIREVLGQIQRFCSQLTGQEAAPAKAPPKPATAKRTFRAEDATIINKDVFALDDDDDGMSSSDDFSALSNDQMSKYESKTMRLSGRDA